MVNLKPRTGDAAIPGHVKQAKDIFMTKLRNIGAYTCCNNVWPHLSIAPPSIEDPDAGVSEDEEQDAEFDDTCNISPTPVFQALSHHSSKGLKEPKRQRQQASSQANQREMINEFFSGHTCEERDCIKFQQQSQLTSLAHGFESSWMKDQCISELLEKLNKRHNELSWPPLSICSP